MGRYLGDPTPIGANHEDRYDERDVDHAEKILSVWTVNFSKMTVNEEGHIRNRVFRQSERPASPVCGDALDRKRPSRQHHNALIAGNQAKIAARPHSPVHADC
jgi:hypothetical protein